jgi:nitroreductase
MTTSQGVSRRGFLRGAAATLVMVAAGGVYRATDQGVFSSATGPAYEAWKTWRSDALTGPLALVRAGILAANPHNTQPWLFRVTDTQITLYADSARHLGAMDPFLREMHIGLGCALENMMLAAQASGFAPTLTLERGTLTEPGSEPKPVRVALLDLSPATPRSSPLYEAIPRRHTDRYPYDASRPVPVALLAELEQLVDMPDLRFFVYRQGEPGYQRFSDETVAATEWIIADPKMSHDSHAWFVTSWEELQREKDGPFIDTSGTSSLVRAISKTIPIPDSMRGQIIDSGWLSNTRSTLATTSVLGFIAVRDLYDKPQSLAAGRLWQRAHLWAATHGLAMQPINQLPEVVDRERQLQQRPQAQAVLAELTGDAAWRPTFAFRLGYPSTTPLPSARRPVEEVMHKA